LNRSRVSTQPAQPAGPLLPAHRTVDGHHHHHHPDPGLRLDCIATNTPPAAAPAARAADPGYHRPQTTVWWLGPPLPRTGPVAVAARRASATSWEWWRGGSPWNRPGEWPEGSVLGVYQRGVILTKYNPIKRNWHQSTKCVFCHHEKLLITSSSSKNLRGLYIESFK
jgi:hypothetical protein